MTAERLDQLHAHMLNIDNEPTLSRDASLELISALRAANLRIAELENRVYELVESIELSELDGL